MVVKLAKEGHNSSIIGLILRDRHGIPLTKSITGKTISQILKDRMLAPQLPEDFNTLLKKFGRRGPRFCPLCFNKI